MGCDIHGTIEKRVGDKWVMLDRLAYDTPCCDRNYKRFTKLAGVRNYDDEKAVEPKGLPTDVSDSTKLYVEEWVADGHSHSYLDLLEAVKIFIATEGGELSEYAKKYPIDYYFDMEIRGNVLDYRLVFWFDN